MIIIESGIAKVLIKCKLLLLLPSALPQMPMQNSP